MERPGNEVYHPSAGLLGRLRDALRVQPAGTSRPATATSDPARFAELSLQIAGCEKLDAEIPPLLALLERSLSQFPDMASTSILLATGRQGEEAQLHASQQAAPGIHSFIRYQLSGVLQDLKANRSLTLPLPASTQVLHCTRLDAAPADGWLMLAGPVNLPASVPSELALIGRAVSRGLSIHTTHRQRLDQALSRERRNHAAELHDSLAQVLGYLRLGASRLDARCGRCNQPDLQAIAADLSQQTRHAYRMLRDLISSSRLTLEGGSLHSALAAAVSEFEQRSALVFELDDRCPQREPDEKCAIQLLMIVREALSNAVRHAHASHLRIQLLPLEEKGLHLRIDDNGEGLNPERRRGDSFGLGIMQERAERIGARLTIGERPGGGTRIDLVLPK
ncbi:sensor histidine kinase [Marinobacterium sp. YM272]|uniref:sensor histidine kinase n=1 Tax=Marinobacterium sp. YM272 TaxID=3421654 RepID=UPI003D7F689C